MAVPEKLVRCSACGEHRGTCVIEGPYCAGTEVRVACLCDGIVCPRCGVRRMHRPISDRYDEASGEVLHVPWFTGLFGCRECRRLRRESGGS